MRVFYACLENCALYRKVGLKKLQLRAFHKSFGSSFWKQIRENHKNKRNEQYHLADDRQPTDVQTMVKTIPRGLCACRLE